MRRWRRWRVVKVGNVEMMRSLAPWLVRLLVVALGGRRRHRRRLRVRRGSLLGGRGSILAFLWGGVRGPLFLSDVGILYLNFSMQSMPLGSSLLYTKQLNASRNSGPQGPCAIPPRQGQSQFISPVSSLKAPC